MFVKISDSEYEVRKNGDVVVPGASDDVQAPIVKRLDSGSLHVLHNNRSTVVRLESVDEKSIRVAVRGFESVAHTQTEKDRLLDRYGIATSTRVGGGAVKAPMPGLVLRTMVAVGDVVSSGQGLLVLEAMKMENELTAPIAGTVASIHVSVGEAVGKNVLLVEITADQ